MSERVMLIDGHPVLEAHLLADLAQGSSPEHMAELREAIAALKLGDQLTIQATPRIIEVAPPGTKPSVNEWLRYIDSPEGYEKT